MQTLSLTQLSVQPQGTSEMAAQQTTQEPSPRQPLAPQIQQTQEC